MRDMALEQGGHINALITGATGQDGSYLAELLLEKGYKVFGLIRRGSTSSTERINHLLNNDNFRLLDGDMTDSPSLVHAIEISQPDEIYNLAAQSFVGSSWKQPIATFASTGDGAVRLFEAAKIAAPRAKIYQASTSEMFGNSIDSPQNEKTVFDPQSPYACAKLYAHKMAACYRQSYGMFISCGILFNHESERRGFEFVTRKITSTLAQIKAGTAFKLRLGNIAAKRDWGHARDYVKAMWLMLQQDDPGDFVIATGETHTVREFCEIAFEITKIGVGLDDSVELDDYLEIDPKFYRPLDVYLLLGDASKAADHLGWKPEIKFKELVKLMINHDLEITKGLKIS